MSTGPDHQVEDNGIITPKDRLSIHCSNSVLSSLSDAETEHWRRQYEDLYTKVKPFQVSHSRGKGSPLLHYGKCSFSEFSSVLLPMVMYIPPYE